MRLQAGGAPAARGSAAGQGNGGRQGQAPARLLGVRVKLAALESGAAQAALAHDCV